MTSIWSTRFAPAVSAIGTEFAGKQQPKPILRGESEKEGISLAEDVHQVV
jgi:hypothetical protein